MDALKGQHPPFAYTSSLPLLSSEDRDWYFAHWHMWQPTPLQWIEAQWAMNVYEDFKRREARGS